MTDATADEDWSVPDSAVIDAIGRSLDGDGVGVLATIVDVEGSAYRQPGAKMVVTDDGAGVGSVTAGCLEDEVQDIARSVREDGAPHLETFDLMEDDVWGLGLGCNGVIDLLFEPLDEGHRRVVEAYETGVDLGVLTVVESDGTALRLGTRAVLPEGVVDAASSSDWPQWVLEDLETPVKRSLASDQSGTVRVERDNASVTVFVDAIRPPPDLIVFGTGHDVRPVVEFGQKADFRVTVVGFRAGLATDERFPVADRVVSTSPGRVREDLALDDETYAVVMTHNFVDDRLAVDELLNTDVPYVGVMGPRERFEEMRAEFDAEGRSFSKTELDRLYTPIGLDLGGGSPYQIALSIVAEVQAVAHGRNPRHLRERDSPIHECVDVEP